MWALGTFQRNVSRESQSCSPEILAKDLDCSASLLLASETIYLTLIPFHFQTILHCLL